MVTATGVDPAPLIRPFRQGQVRVERQTSSSWAVLEYGHTDDNGYFTFDLPTGSVAPNTNVRVIACTVGLENDKIAVRTPGVGGSGAGRLPFCFFSEPTSSGQDPSYISFGTITPADTDQSGGPFNIYNNLLEAYQFLTDEVGAPTNSLTAYWDLGYTTITGGAYYSNVDGVIRLTGTEENGDQWDDAVIMHEIGHWVMDTYAETPPNSDGDHGNCTEGTARPNLEYSEGWATFFSTASRNASRDATVRASALNYVDTSGGLLQQGSRFVFISGDLETPTIYDSTTDRGTYCEWQVAATLWDVVDSNADASDTLQRSFADVFTAFSTPLPFASGSHYPYNINEWWYNWTNTLNTRTGASLGDEQAMLDNFTDHRIDVGIRLSLTWNAPPEDYDAHLWLPEATPREIGYFDLGDRAADPFVEHSGDDQTGATGEEIWITSPYPGFSRYAVHDYSDTWDDMRGIAGTNAQVKIVDGSEPLPDTFAAPGVGTGDWWYLMDIDVLGGHYIANEVVEEYPAPYDLGGGGGEEIIEGTPDRQPQEGKPSK